MPVIHKLEYILRYDKILSRFIGEGDCDVRV